MADARSVVVRLSMDVAQAIRASQQFGTEMDRAMRKAEASTMSQSQAMDHLGGQAGRMATAAAAGLALFGKAAVDWESQFAGVEKTVDGTVGQMSELEDELRELARTMPATHQEIAATAEAAGQLGVAREDVVDFTETMLQLGETTNLTADQAATSIAQMANVMGTAGTDIDNLGASLVAAGNAGASTEAQIIQMAQGIAGAAKVVGLTEAEVIGIANSVASIGIEVEAGGTAISRVLTDMAKAVSQGGEKLDSFAEAAGVSAEDFARAFEERPAEALTMFVEGLGQINAAGGDVFTTLDQLGMSDVRVSRALLGMAADSERFAGDLSLASEAWAENTALTDEYGKRVETTAAQVQIAWNNIKDAGIDGGAALLPIIADAAEGVAALAQAYQELPGPVQGGVTALLGVGAAVGGTFWLFRKLVTSVSETKVALETLGVSGDKASAAMKGLGIAAGAAATLLAVEAAAARATRAMDDAAPSASDLAKQLADIGDPDAMAAIGAGLGDLRGSLETLADPGLAQKLGEVYDAIPGGSNFADIAPGLRGVRTEVREATADFAALDEALTSLAAMGGVEAAEKAFGGLADAYGLTADEQQQLLDLLPNYSGALDQEATAALLAGEATEELGEKADGAGAGLDKMGEALKESRDAAQDTATEFFNLGESLNDAEVSLGEWIADMEEQATALRDFRLNAEEAGEKGLRQGLIKALQEAGPEGALRMAELANATDAEIKRANRAWQAGQREIDKYTDAVGGVEPAELDVNTAEGQAALRELEAQLERYGLTRETATAALEDVASGKIKTVQGLIDKYGITRAQAKALLEDNATGAINAVRGNLQALDGDVATVTIRTVRETVQRFVKGLNPFSSADGGSVPKDGGPYEDRYLYMLAPGEEVISNRYGQADRFRADRAAGRIPGYADGGTVHTYARGLANGGTATGISRSDLRAFDPDAGMKVREINAELREFRKAVRDSKATWTKAMSQQADKLTDVAQRYNKVNRALEKNERRLEKQTAALEDLQRESQAYGDRVAGTFDGDIFGNGVAGLMLQLEADRNDLFSSTAAWQQAMAKGLDGPLLEELMASRDLNTAQQIAGLSAQEIADLERLYAEREFAQQTASMFAQREVYGEALALAQVAVDKTEQTIAKTEATMKTLSDKLERIEFRIEKGVRVGTREGAREGLNDLAKGANQKKKARKG